MTSDIDDRRTMLREMLGENAKEASDALEADPAFAYDRMIARMFRTALVKGVREPGRPIRQVLAEDGFTKLEMDEELPLIAMLIGELFAALPVVFEELEKRRKQS